MKEENQVLQQRMHDLESQGIRDDDDDTDIDISHIYRDNATEVMPMQLNPMRDPEGLETNDKNITAVQSENMEYQMKNMKEENQVL